MPAGVQVEEPSEAGTAADMMAMFDGGSSGWYTIDRFNNSRLVSQTNPWRVLKGTKKTFVDCGEMLGAVEWHY